MRYSSAMVKISSWGFIILYHTSLYCIWKLSVSPIYAVKESIYITIINTKICQFCIQSWTNVFDYINWVMMLFIYSAACLKCLLWNSPGSTLLKPPREKPLGSATSRDDSELPSRDCATFLLFPLQTISNQAAFSIVNVLLNKRGQESINDLQAGTAYG